MLGRQFQCNGIARLLCVGITTFRTNAEPHVRLQVVLVHAEAFDIADAQVELRNRVPLRRGQLVPLRCLCVVLDHANTLAVHIAQADLRFDMPLLCCQPVPPGGYPIVPANAGAFDEVDGQVVLSLCRSQPVPLHGLVVVLRYATALLMDKAQVDLRSGVPLFSSQPVPLQRLGMVWRQDLANGKPSARLSPRVCCR